MTYQSGKYFKIFQRPVPPVSFFLLISAVYLKDISTNWSYMGFGLEYSSMKLLISLAIIISLSLFMSRKITVQNFFFSFIVYAYIVPALVLFSFGGNDYFYIWVSALGFLAFFSVQNLRIPRVRIVSLTGKSILTACFSLVCLVVISMIALGAYKNFNINLLKVYDFRRESAMNLPGAFGYILSPVSKVVLPLGVALGIYYRSTLFVVLFSALTVLFFGLTHHKSVLFSPFLVALIFTLLRRSTDLRFLHVFFILIGALGLLECLYLEVFYEVNGGGMFSSIIIRRVFLLPPLLDQYYLDFFSANDFTYWSNSRISMGMVPSVYELSAPYLIGERFFSNAAASANTGFIGSGFSNAGIVGVMVYGLILGGIVAVLNGNERALGSPITISASLIVMVSTITTTDLITSLLTHGLLFLILLLSIMPRMRGDK